MDYLIVAAFLFLIVVLFFLPGMIQKLRKPAVPKDPFFDTITEFRNDAA